MKIAIICAPGLEECEALLTNDLLRRANFETKLLGLEKEITSSHNVTFTCDGLLKDEDLSDYDCLVLPGGIPGVNNLEASSLVQDAIDLFVKQDKYIAAVCAAPSILIHKGLLESNKFTCYPSFEENLTRVNEKAYVHNKFITGCGLGGTIEFASLIISTLTDNIKAMNVLMKIQY